MANGVVNLRMNSGDYKCIWQASDWTNWHFDLAALAQPMAAVIRAQGLLSWAGRFEGKLTSSKWAAIAQCSLDNALRDITDLLARGVLLKADAGGRSTSYELNEPAQATDSLN